MNDNAGEPVGAAEELRQMSSAALVTGESGVPARVLLAPWGRVQSTSGEFVFDEEAGAAVLAAFAEHGTDIPIDYEHQTLGGVYASPSGQAPAAGWIKELTVEQGKGLMAAVAWTDRAQELLGSKAYRYLSPVAIVRKHDGRMVALHSAALTNKPAIVGMEPIVNRVAEGAGEADAVEALRCRLELEPGVGTEALLRSACGRIAELHEEREIREAEQRVARALSAGKLCAAQQAWAVELVRRAPELYAQWEATAPVVVAVGATVPPRGGPGRDGRRESIEARARTEYRSESLLQRLTEEEAYVADALRAAS